MSDARPELVLYHFPGACSQVSVCALEMAALPYDLKLVNLMTDAQNKPDYLALSPLGKVPVLMIDGKPLYENAAIITYAALRAPASGVFPADLSPVVRAEIVGGLSFCAGTLHPLVRGVANPVRMTSGDVEGVRAKSTVLLGKSLAYAETRLTGTGWWFEDVSIIDVYLNWAVSVARNAGFDLLPFPVCAGLADRLNSLPAFATMIDREKQLRTSLGLSK